MTATTPVEACGGVVAIPLGELLSMDEYRQDWRALSVPNLRRLAMVRRGDRGAMRLPERLSTLVVDNGRALYPSAAASVYRARLRGRAYDLDDTRPRFVPEPLESSCTLTAYQARSVDALAAVSAGQMLAACGSGKGEAICSLVGRLGVPPLVLVSQVDQAVELHRRLSTRLGVTVGIIGGGERRIERITVAVVQALDPATVDEIAPLFEVVIRDEVHHAAAETEIALWRRLRARRWYGFSATPREDGLQPFVDHFFGKVVATVTREELVEAGRSVEPSFTAIPTSFTARYDGPEDWAPLLDALERDEERACLVVDQVVHHGAGQLSAVLTGRIAHAERIGDMLRARGLRVQTLSSKRTKRDRTAAIDAARAGELDVIVGTQLLDEAIDVPRLSRVFLVWPAKAEGRLVQKVGRALRPHPSKAPPRIFDFVDERVGVLRHQARIRRRVFAKHWPDQQVAA